MSGVDGKQLRDNSVVLAKLVQADLPAAFAPESQRLLTSALPTIAGAALTSGRAYWVYVGRTVKAITVNGIECWLTNIGTVSQTAEVALASTPSAPNRAASQTLTKIAATGALDSLTSGTGLKRNSTAFNQVVFASVHLWAGIRVAMSLTQPSMFGLTGDWNDGQILITSGASALTGSTTWSGAVLSAAIAWQAPALRVTLD
jgi:hypothetical protein